MGDCLFCSIAAGEISSQKVYSDDDFFAFRDINPQAPTHIQLIPRKHFSTILDIEEEDAALMGRMLMVANEISEKEGIAGEGVRYVINCNAGAGQTVFHIHLHIVGGRPLGWPPG
ncbi:histidine triad nucleotide-binding protein [Candidatus Hydrogenedentota bacterium]